MLTLALLTITPVCVYLCWSVQSHHNTESLMSARVNEVPSQLDMEAFDCKSAGPAWRAWRRGALRILAGRVDKSGCSLALSLIHI